MVKRMLIDAAHEEEMRVAVVDGNRLEDFDFESKIKKQIKGNIFLAKVTRVEPSLQACFVEYGGNRQGFLAFSEIHPDYYRIPVEDREALLEEERRLAELEEQEAEIEDEKEAKKFKEEPKKSDDVEPEDEITVVSDGEVSEIVTPEDNAEDNNDNDIVLAKNETEDKKISGTVEDNSEDNNDDDVKKGGDTKKSSPKQRKKTTRSKKKVDKEDSADKAEVKDNSETEKSSDKVEQNNDDKDATTGDDKRRSNRRRKPSMRKRYKIQEVITRRQIMLVQVTKEERGNKGAALTSYISLPGRYCVLMPNSPRGGGISRKISNPKDRRRMREIIKELQVPEGMSVILRTAGLQRKSSEIKRDLDYLLRMWNNIRQSTLESTAPSLIYEEGDLAKRAIRDLYSADIDEILVNEDESYRTVKEFMKMLIPSHAKKIKQYKEGSFPLFHRYQVESQIEEVYNPDVKLKSGGYIVINPTEALVSIDVNSGKSTKERNIDETALKTNLEAAEEVARQLRLRDLGGLVVVDFIDMENHRHNMKVERKMREAMSGDRARVEVGRLSQFGLLELSRQRLRPSFSETHFEQCLHCKGIGLVRTVESASVIVLRELEEEGIRNRAEVISVTVPSNVALYLLNQKRSMLEACEKRYNVTVFIRADDKMARNDYSVEPTKARSKSPAKNTQDQPLEMGSNNSPEQDTKTAETKVDNNNDEVQIKDGEEENKSEDSSSPSRRDNNRRRRSPYRNNRRSGYKGRRNDNDKDNVEKTNNTNNDSTDKSLSVSSSENVTEQEKSKPVVTKSEPKLVKEEVKPKEDRPLVVGSDAGVQSVNQKPEQPKKGWWKKLVD